MNIIRNLKYKYSPFKNDICQSNSCNKIVKNILILFNKTKKMKSIKY